MDPLFETHFPYVLGAYGVTALLIAIALIYTFFSRLKVNRELAAIERLRGRVEPAESQENVDGNR